ncbi:MAG: hypothetical protein IPO31_17050 [Candidatus Obscuribacter sp.]|nr:hypothetical protein [Candidatus Obscuribacter sp.]
MRKLVGMSLALALAVNSQAAWARSGDSSAGKSGGKAAMTKIAVVKANKKPMVEKYLLEGNLAKGEVDLTARLESHPKDDQARFGLGVLQFLQAVEGLSQDLYRYGLRNVGEDRPRLPMLNMPITTNPDSESIDYQKWRGLIDRFYQKVTAAEATLAQVTDADVKLPLHFGMIKLDFTGKKDAEQKQGLWKVFANLTRHKTVTEAQSSRFYIKFDRGDVHWLRGYCNVFAAVCNMYLAHDSKEMFDRTGFLLFRKVDSAYPDLGRDTRIAGRMEHIGDLLDFVAMIHLVSWDVVEPKRMEAALHNMEAVIAQSRETWRFIMAETDDDQEWLPNPRQTGVIPGANVSEEMVASWAGIMDESEMILSGRLLLPFWRGDGTRGINLRKVFLAPRRFDLVLWIQGGAALPYLERGPLTHGSTWRELRSDFGHHFPGFALWFN